MSQLHPIQTSASVSYAPQPASPESLTGVLGQTNEHLSHIESQLLGLLQRISPRPEKTQGTVGLDQSGVLNSAMAARNAASRILDQLAQLENLL